jgi:hypothetical protein
MVISCRPVSSAHCLRSVTGDDAPEIERGVPQHEVQLVQTFA